MPRRGGFTLSRLEARCRRKWNLPLVASKPKTCGQKFAQVALRVLTRGTHITMSNGEQLPMKIWCGCKYSPAMMAVQAIAGSASSTVRAVGEFARSALMRDTEHDNDLIVSPDHRLFFTNAKTVWRGRLGTCWSGTASE